MKAQPTQFNNVGNVLEVPVEVPPVRPERHPGQRPVPARRPVRRRPGDRPLDGLQLLGAHQRQLLPAHRQRAAGPAQHGAWVTYGLGSECQDLPGFVVLNGGLIPPGGLDCFNSGFLPAAYQGSIFKPGDTPRGQHQPGASRSPQLQRRKLDLLARRSTRACSAGSATTTASKRRSPTTSWPSACRPPCPS